MHTGFWGENPYYSVQWNTSNRGLIAFSIVENSAKKGNSQQILKYLCEIEQFTTERQEEEAFLKQEMGNVIFPFSFNLSQRTALEQALTHLISVIKGPPGTGKTQTILNILANLVLRGQGVLLQSLLEDEILRKYHVPLLRLATNGSQERGKIEKMPGKDTEKEG